MNVVFFGSRGPKSTTLVVRRGTLAGRQIPGNANLSGGEATIPFAHPRQVLPTVDTMTYPRVFPLPAEAVDFWTNDSSEPRFPSPALLAGEGEGEGSFFLFGVVSRVWYRALNPR